MAGIFNDDDSTDDEIGVNLQLAERLRINRENCKFMEDTSLEDSKELKQICNMHRKKFAQNRNSSSSSSVELQSDNPSGISSDSYHNKKRQNGDKNVEQLANPKRTCLSDRFRRSPEWRDLRKKENQKLQSKQSKFSDPLQVQSTSSPDLFPHRKNEEHVNSLADAEDSDFEIPPRITRNCKKSNGHSSKTSKNHSSESADTNQLANLENKPSTSFFRALIESGSDDDSIPVMQNGALKGGRPESSDHSSYAKRLFGRKVNKKVLDSDESEDDSSVAAYRSRPLVFSSSDSEKDFRQTASQSKQNAVCATASNSIGQSLPYSAGYDRNSRNPRQYKSYRPNQKSHKKTFNALPSSRADGSDVCDRQFLSPEFQCKTTPTPPRPCRARRSPRMNIAANITSNSISNGNSTSAPVRGRRVSGADRGSRRTGSPHHRNHHSQPRCDDCRGRSVSSSRSRKNLSTYAARYPELFDAEESENEFFTANSYSDTETSTESLGAVTINASFPTHRGGTISCSIDCDGDGTTDDEIIVLYSAGPYGRTNEARRGGTRTLGRRFNRGTTPHRQLQNAQEVVSLSPDPVEQVRQMEEDERMARMLQAQFDAEVDPDYTPAINPAVEPQADSDSDDSSSIIDPVGDSDSEGSMNFHHTGFFSVMSPPPSRFRMNRFTNRPPTPNSMGLGIGAYVGNRRYNGRNRRRFQLTSRETNMDFQIARLFGLGIPSMGDFFGGADEYETLLSLDLGGEVMPRGLHKSDINRLPTRKYVHPNSASSSAGTSSSATAHKRTELNKECQVCLTDYETGDILRILPCFHEFHTPCIDPWLKINHTCPVCRVTVDLES